MDKGKFLQNPHLDSEGFVNYTAECLGCQPGDMCPRSGHCVNADQRHHIYGIPAWLVEHRELVAEADARCDGCQASPWSMLDQDHLDRIHAIWLNSKPAMQQHLRRLHEEARCPTRQTPTPRLRPAPLLLSR